MQSLVGTLCFEAGDLLPCCALMLEKLTMALHCLSSCCALMLEMHCKLIKLTMCLHSFTSSRLKLALLVIMSRKGSLKRRLHDDADKASEEHEAAAPMPASSEQMPKAGGARRRLCGEKVDQPFSASSSSYLPLSNLLKSKWCKGSISSPEVQEFALAAAQQGWYIVRLSFS